jgi:putative phosphoribosyl transferase
MFADRKEAGKKLAGALKKKDIKDPMVLAIPRGGVEVGYYVVRHLDAEFSLIVTRKLPFPYNPEAGFGAMAEDGSLYIQKEALDWLDKKTINNVIDEQKKEIQRRIQALRKNEPFPNIENRNVILVDDGIAMGSTIRASIAMCQKKGASRVIVAAPVSGPGMENSLLKECDDVIILEQPIDFQAVAQVYLNWYDVSDSEVNEFMRKWKTEKNKGKDSTLD